MEPVSPVVPGHEQNEIMFAKDQPEYMPLPALPVNYANGKAFMTRWKLSADELAVVAETGCVYLTVWTFGRPLQPVLLEVESPFASKPAADDEFPEVIGG